MEISVLDTNFLTYVVKPFSYPKNYKKTKQSHFATTSRPVEGFSHEDSSSLRGGVGFLYPRRSWALGKTSTRRWTGKDRARSLSGVPCFAGAAEPGMA